MSTPLRVLIVEDSEDDAMLLIRELRHGGYTPSFERVDTPDTLRTALRKKAWDLVITDHNMPCFDSTAALSLVKESGRDLPVIIVSGSIGEEIAVAAMKGGAHDYIMKNNLARLVPAIEREMRDVETRRAHRQAEDTIRHMAYHDALTGLVNRREFEYRLEQALISAKKRRLSYALLYLDLDQFKIINDTCGHVAGDELLKQLATVLQAQIRESDTLARLGGDEFGVLLQSCPIKRARRIAETLLEMIKDFHFVWQNKSFRISASVGLVNISDESTTLNDVLSAADVACYAAKDLGRNRIHVYAEGDSELIRRHGEMQWVSRINQALEDNRFLLYWQAIVPLGSRSAEGQYYEFLIRLRDNSGHIVLPGAFIPSAERYNLMPTLDRWVVYTAFAHLAQTYRKNGNSQDTVGTFFINLSGTSLNDNTFSEFIREQLDRYNLPPEMICFEITETAAIANLSNALQFVKDIKKQGCRFALDDFGSGLSSFSYLKTLPVDYLKIDGSFVRDVVHDHMNCAIVKAINQIGHVADIQTIAEHVETESIKRKLHTIGVDYVQGYGIEKPQPITDCFNDSTISTARIT